MLEIYRKTLKGESVQKLNEIEVGSWIYSVNPTKEEIEILVEKFGIEIGFIRDALDIYEAPRIEEENGIFYILTRLPYKEDEKLTTTPLLIIFTPKNIITVSSRPVNILDNFISGKTEFYTTQKAKFLIQIFLKISRSYEQHVKSITRTIHDKKIILRKLDNKDLVNLVELEEILNDFITSLVPTIAVFEKIMSGKFIKLFEEDKELIEDLVIASRQSLELCKTNIKSIVNTREAYSAILTNNLNKIMKFLASITIILTIPTIIASVYGMNIGLPFQKNPFAFSYVILIVIFIVIFFLWFFYKKKWL